MLKHAAKQKKKEKPPAEAIRVDGKYYKPILPACCNECMLKQQVIEGHNCFRPSIVWSYMEAFKGNVIRRPDERGDWYIWEDVEAYS